MQFSPSIRTVALKECRYSTVSTLLQYYLFMPLPQKDVHLIYLANSLAQNSIIIFTRTVHDAQRYMHLGLLCGHCSP